VKKALAILALLLVAAPAQAMHISEGILPLNWALLWLAMAVPCVGLGIRRMNALGRDDLAIKPLIGLLAAVVFIVSCLPIPVPTAGTCSHPCGTAIAAILVGPWISILIAGVALLIQALFLAHGGLSTWGADVVAMGVVGSCAGWLAFAGLRRCGAGLGVAAFCAGVVTDWGTYLTTSCILAAGIRGSDPFWPLASKIVVAFVPTQLPLGLLEGAMTAGMVTLLARKRPDLLVKMRVLKTVVVCFFALTLFLLTPSSSLAANWSGVDESVVEKIAKEHGREAVEPVINTDRGDLLLFVFLLAGAVGGFAAGYSWRMLTAEKRPTREEPR